jgi:hypothetical protein
LELFRFWINWIFGTKLARETAQKKKGIEEEGIGTNRLYHDTRFLPQDSEDFGISDFGSSCGLEKPAKI